MTKLKDSEKDLTKKWTGVFGRAHIQNWLGNAIDQMKHFFVDKDLDFDSLIGPCFLGKY